MRGVNRDHRIWKLVGGHGHDVRTRDRVNVPVRVRDHDRESDRDRECDRDLDRDPALYEFPVEGSSRGVFTQFLFSYKLNAQTVVFLGYSDNSLGARGIDLVRSDRTLFFKIGYAWVM